MAVPAPIQSPVVPAHDSSAQVTAPLGARVVLGGARGESTVVDLDEVRLARRSLVFRAPWPVPAGSHAWFDVTLPGGRRIRPLVVVLGNGADGLVSARYVHLFPDQRRALDAFLATPSGY